MPAPAVIPAPRAYINAAAVKGFVVGFRVGESRWSTDRITFLSPLCMCGTVALRIHSGGEQLTHMPYAKGRPPLLL